jgi:tetratricopeptide (TPR) repeat protein
LNTAPKVIPPPVAAPQPNRLSITQETLAQAQSLWNTGAREAALDLMREAVAVTERAYNSGALPADSPVLASLVRELSRMELADGRPARVLDLLIRLEPALQKQADLWAVRGNAAQRLARHQESLMAYNHALAIRPDEPRWMLACAVSLAALGRFEESAEQAEKANVSGIVSPEILLYLKQVGVPVKPK